MTIEFHRGRLLDHLHLHSANLEASKRFYRAVAGALGHSAAFVDEGDYFYLDELFVDGVASEPPTRVHFAFQASDRETVERFYRSGLAAGGRDNGAPGQRPYHPGYYAAFLLDPDDNNVEAVYHGPATRSAASVVIKPA
jgi:catechol 2,3-dioxygenase-like lactoylglutathione lyase family enzyme